MSVRKDSLVKATGKLQYTDDFPCPDCLNAVGIGVTATTGILNKINFDENYDWSGFTIAVNADILSENLIPPGPEDEPIVVDREIGYYGQPAVLLAHTDPKKLKEASVHITFNIEDAPSSEEIFAKKVLIQGSIETGFAESDQIIEGRYTTQAQEHLYLETQIVIAKFDAATKTLYLEGAMQAPQNVQIALQNCFQNRVSEVIVTPHFAGGAFGGREDFTTKIALQASLLSLKSGRPVKMKLSRRDDLMFSTKRHPSVGTVKVGLKKDEIRSLDFSITLDAGAYSTISPIVLNRSIMHPGSFRSPNLRVTGLVVKTNTPPNGAFRGFGAPQSFFAVESHLDHVIRQLNFDPVDFRLKNLLTADDKNIAGETLGEPGVKKVFEELIAFSNYQTLKDEVALFNKSNSKKKRGLGLSSVFHGTGYTGFQDIDTPISVSLKLNTDGSVIIQSSVIEYGQGSHTVLPLIAAKVLEISPEKISLENINTKVTPGSGATVASRTTTVLGGLVAKAALKLKPQVNSGEEVVINEKYERTGSFDYQSMTGKAYENYPSAALLSLIEVDLVTYNVKVISVYQAIDSGEIIDHSGAEAQVQGAVLMGLGYALLEQMVMGDKGYQNQTLSQYTFPTALETPNIKIKFIETPGVGPKGLGEMPLDGMAASIGNALEDALSHRFCDLPFTPEKIAQGLESD